jgi:hypothetical protein
MKTILLSFVSLLILTTAQAQRDKEFQIRGGFGFAVYGTTSEITLTNFSPELSFTDDDGAATVHIPIELRYELTRRFNIGLDAKLGSYLYNPDSTEGKTNHFFTIGAAAEFNIINGDNFRLYAGAGVNTGTLTLKEESQVPGVDLSYESTYKGGGFRMNAGILWFFAGNLGLNANLGFDSHDFELNAYRENGQEQDLSNVKATLTINGMDGTIGLVQRF